MGRKKNNKKGCKPAGQNNENLPSFYRPMESKKRNGLLVMTLSFLMMSSGCECYRYGSMAPFSRRRLRIINEASRSRHSCWYHHHDSVVFQKFCNPPSINRETTTRLFSKNNNPSDNKSSLSLSLRKKMVEASSSSIRKLRIGASSLLRNYWKHCSRLALACYITSCLIVAETTGQFIAEPLVRFFGMITGTKAWWYPLQAQGYLQSKLDPWSAGESPWSSFTLIPIIEEFLQQICLLQFLKFICRRLYKTKNDDDKVVSKAPPLLTPWSIISSLVFAAGHIDLWNPNFLPTLWGPDFGPLPPLGREQLAGIAKAPVENFFLSLFLYIPLYERHGIFASIGAHSMWNLVCVVPRAQTVLLTLHFLHRVGFLRLLLRREDSSSAEEQNVAPLLQRVCEYYLELALLYSWIISPILGVFGY